ncbi:MAG: hypothetical protein KTR25_13230 [Myxococcales bacterium]|nr:hypothetical protein [Myxococcales bacterium]
MLVQEAVVRAFREAGFWVIVSGGAPTSADIPEVQIRIEQFWAWMTPGFWSVGLDFQGRLVLSGIPRHSDMTVNVRISRRSFAASGSRWKRVINEGVEGMVQKLREGAERVRSSPSPSTTVQWMQESEVTAQRLAW